MSYMRYRQARKKPRWQVHPVWRGIGCLMLIIIPIMSYAISVLLVQENIKKRWVLIPRELVRTINLPLVGPVRNFYLVLLLTLVIAVILFSVLTIFYSVLYRVVGPPQYGPTDAPPLRRR